MIEMVIKQAEVVVTADARKQETMNAMTTVSARVFSYRRGRALCGFAQ
jgi:hypothetical protein